MKMQSSVPASDPLSQQLHAHQVPLGSCVCLAHLHYHAARTQRKTTVLLLR
jgi:hypothetical protein